MTTQDETTITIQPPIFAEQIFKQRLTDGSIEEVYRVGDGTGDTMAVIIPPPKWAITAVKPPTTAVVQCPFADHLPGLGCS